MQTRCLVFGCHRLRGGREEGEREVTKEQKNKRYNRPTTKKLKANFGTQREREREREQREPV